MHAVNGCRMNALSRAAPMKHIVAGRINLVSPERTMNHFIELVTFKTRAGVTTEQVTSAAEEVNVFLKSQPGFLSRQLGLAENGTWYDILYWESQDHVTAAMAEVASSPHCSIFFGLIDPAHDSMALFPSLIAAEHGPQGGPRPAVTG